MSLPQLLGYLLQLVSHRLHVLYVMIKMQIYWFLQRQTELEIRDKYSRFSIEKIELFDQSKFARLFFQDSKEKSKFLEDLSVKEPKKIV